MGPLAGFPRRGAHCFNAAFLQRQYNVNYQGPGEPGERIDLLRHEPGTYRPGLTGVTVWVRSNRFMRRLWEE